ncbi:MAG: LamG domain-containing protein, partial [Pseudomonadota bacterium]
MLWCGVASGALVAEYRFDADRWQNVSGEVLDSTANARHGRAIGLSTTAGLLCNSADLSAAGETDYVSLPADVLNGLNDFTLMVWYRSTYTDREMFISAANSSQVRELQWFKRNATRWQPRIKNTADGRLDASNVADGNWHHVAWTRSGGNTCLYVDGALQDCNTLSAGALNVATLFVGQELTDVSGSVRNNRGVRGTLDELYVFDQALTATEIDNIRGQSLAGNNWDGTPRLCDAAIDPIADYRFDEQSWSGVAGEVLDSGANAYHGVSIGATVAADGLLCRAGDFSATGTEHVSLDAGALDGLGDFTLSLWGRTGSTASWQTLVSGANAGTTNELVMLFDSASQFYPGISITFFADAAEISSATFNDNNWHHFVWTRDTSANRSCFYLDGNLQGCSNHPSAADADPLQIDPNGFVLGQDQDSVGGGFETSQAWNGLLDELLVFDLVLSDALIAQIFTNQSAGANWDGTERTCQLTPRAEYRFDAATWNGNPGEVLDSGADALHGTASQVSPVTGLVCNAADFSAAGTADYVSLDYRALDGLTNFTVSLWVNSANVNNKALISGARAGQSNALIYWYNNASLFGGYVDNSAAFVQGNNVFDGQWHHLVWVRSGTQHCLYTDGALRGCATGSGVTLDVDAGGLILGQEQDSLGGGFVASQAMTGLMDELLIFDLALDAAGINSIYQNQLAGLNWDGTTRTCPVVAANRLQVIHDGSGIHCA